MSKPIKLEVTTVKDAQGHQGVMSEEYSDHVFETRMVTLPITP
jgi:hypothetical protein